jgi:hypothetical protein
MLLLFSANEIWLLYHVYNILVCNVTLIFKGILLLVVWVSCFVFCYCVV